MDARIVTFHFLSFSPMIFDPFLFTISPLTIIKQNEWLIDNNFPAHSSISDLDGNLLKKLTGTEGNLLLNLGCRSK